MGIFDTYNIPENCLDEVFDSKTRMVKEPLSDN